MGVYKECLIIVVNNHNKWLVVRGPTLHAQLWCDIASSNTVIYYLSMYLV